LHVFSIFRNSILIHYCRYCRLWWWFRVNVNGSSTRTNCRLCEKFGKVFDTEDDEGHIVDVRALEPNRSHSSHSLRLKRDLRNSVRLCIHFKSHLNAGASRPTHTPTHIDTRARVAHVSRTHTRLSSFRFIHARRGARTRSPMTQADGRSQYLMITRYIRHYVTKLHSTCARVRVPRVRSRYDRFYDRHGWHWDGWMCVCVCVSNSAFIFLTSNAK